MTSLHADNALLLSTLSVLELECLLDKQLKIKETLWEKLPDRGNKLDKFIKKIKSLIDDRKKNIGPELMSSGDTQMSSKPRHHKRMPDDTVEMNSNEPLFSIDKEPDSTTLDESNHNDEVYSLTSDLANLYLRSKHEPDESDDFTTIPELDVREFSTLWHSLNLPSLQPKSYHWFVFTLRIVNELAYLVVVDCACPSRYMVRMGSQKVWFPDSHVPTLALNDSTLSSEHKSKPLDQSVQALHDLWNFISSEHESDSTIPCLLSYSTNQATNTVDDLTWLSRLLRSTRHSRLARCSLVPNCRFSEASRALRTKLGIQMLAKLHDDALKSNDPDWSPREQFVNECRWVSELLFPNPELFDQVQFFSSVSEFLQDGLVRSLTWMEAPMELRLLRQLKQNSIQMNKPANKPSLSTIPDTMLRLLACLGLGRTRLTRLAGLGRWAGFSGFLSFGCFDLLSAELQVHKQKHKVLVTSEKQTLIDLYQYFSLIYRHMIRHERCYEDRKSGQSTMFTFVRPRLENRLSNSAGQLSSLVGQDRIQAWTSSGNNLFDPMGSLQLKLINFEQSTKLMRQSVRDWSRDDANHFPMKAPSTNISHYRDPTAVVHTFMDDDDDDDNDVVSDNSLDSDSSGSFKLEDVD